MTQTLFLKPLSSLGVKESALPITGMTLTRGERRRINSMSISRKLRPSESGTSYRHCNLRVSRRRDEVQQGMNPVVSETRVTFDPRFFSQDIVILTFQVTDNLLKAYMRDLSQGCWGSNQVTYANSLSMLSPNPGVSTIVRAIRTPSSSSSGYSSGSCIFPDGQLRTDIDRLDSNAFFEMSRLWVVRDFVCQNLGLAKGVHECGATSARSTLWMVS